MWGIIPAAGRGSRIQPLAFSKELLPVGSQLDAHAVERPRAISDYLVDRMRIGGVTKICFVIAPGKSDIVAYHGASVGDVQLCYAVQPEPRGLCDALFRALPFIAPDEEVLVGLPDTLWMPEDGFRHLGRGLSFLCFPVQHPELFDAVVADDAGRVREIQVKQPHPHSNWIWGAFKLNGRILAELNALWLERDRADEYLGTLVNAWLARGGRAQAVYAGEAYVDVGTLGGYRAALELLQGKPSFEAPAAPPKPPPDALPDDVGQLSQEALRRRVEQLAPWFHNLDLRGVRTAPDHFLGDYPNMKYQRFAHALPADLEGRSVLDVGCNAGFYSMEMKRRGAGRVLGVDSDPRYLAQARFAAAVSGFRDLEFRQLDVYDVGHLGERFDLVIFMGVLYHLRHPLLALDLLRSHVCGDLLLFQSMQRGSPELPTLQPDYPFEEHRIFHDERFPRLAFVEHAYAHDPTNWWVPNRACTEAMLRSAGFRIVGHPEEEVYLCRVDGPAPHAAPRATPPQA